MKEYFTKEYLLQNKEKAVKVIIIALILIAAFIIFLMREHAGAENNEYLKQPANAAEETFEANKEGAENDKGAENRIASATGESIVVDVSGAVNTPSVVTLNADGRVEDAIRAAGGLKDNADLTDINRAAFLTDGEKIIVPTKDSSSKKENRTVGNEQKNDEINTEVNSSLENDGKININIADSAKLQELNGIGPALSERIIEYRENNGNFKTIEDIKSVSGIGDKTFEKFKNNITV